MALKAYKHLTDGEVKLVEADSAEEAGLVADVVHGASYIQLQNDGTREEVAASQGTALWVDVTDELGGGGSAFAHLTEDTENSKLVADWPLDLGAQSLILNGIEIESVTAGANITVNGNLQATTGLKSPAVIQSIGTGGRSAKLNHGSAGVFAPAADTEVLFVYDADGDQNFAVFSASADGTLWCSDGTNASVSGVLVQSPDGLTTKVIGIDNAGALALTTL